jgi:hypothetical protein
VHLDAGHADGPERIVEGERRVRERAAVEQQPRVGAAALADAIEQIALVVRLEGVDLDAELLATRLEAPVDVGERLLAVDLRLARAEQLEIRPREDEDAGLQSSAMSFGAAVRIK